MPLCQKEPWPVWYISYIPAISHHIYYVSLDWHEHKLQLDWRHTTMSYPKSNPISFSAVQVNSADQRLRVFDSTQKRWRQVCSSSANELLASISCEEVGFVRWDIFTVISQWFHAGYYDRGLKCVCLFKCGELLSHISARGQWRWWGVLLCQTGRAQLWQENQRLIVPMVRNTCMFDAVSQQSPLSSLLLLLPFSFTRLLG